MLIFCAVFQKGDTMKPLHWVLAVLAFALGLWLFVALLQSQSAPLTFFLNFNFNITDVFFVFVLSLLYACLGGWKWQLITRQWQGTAPSLNYHFAQTSYAMLIAQFLPFPIATALQRSAAMKLRQKTPVFQGMAHAIFDVGFDLWVILLFLPISIATAKFHFSFPLWLAGGLASIALFFSGFSGFALLPSRKTHRQL